MMKGNHLVPSLKAIHLGVTRTNDGSNHAAVWEKISTYNRALVSLLPVGLILKHHGSPSAALMILDMYCSPIVLNDISSLMLTNKDTNLLAVHWRKNLPRAMCLHTRTLAAEINLLSGVLPIEAQIGINYMQPY